MSLFGRLTLKQPARARPPSLTGRGQKLVQAWQSPAVQSSSSSSSAPLTTQDQLPSFATPPLRRAAVGSASSVGVSQQHHVPIPRLAVQVLEQAAVVAEECDSLAPPQAQGEGDGEREGVGLTPLAKGVTGVHI